MGENVKVSWVFITPRARNGSRAAILECIESYLDTVLELETHAINVLRHLPKQLRTP